MTMDGRMLMHDPLRPPQWRCLRVVQLLRHRPEPLRPRWHDDHAVRAYFHFLSAASDAAGDERALAAVFHERQHVAGAHRLHYAPDIELREILEARLLTSETYEEIANRIGISPEAVDYYEQLFFDVRGRQGAKDWLIKVILGPPLDRASGKKGTITVQQRGFLYRLFGYYGGPLVLDALISGIGDVRMPRHADEVSAWFDDALRMTVRTRAAAAARLFEFNKQSAMQVMKLALRAQATAGKTHAAAGKPLDEAYLTKMVAAIEPYLGNGAPPAIDQ